MQKLAIAASLVMAVSGVSAQAETLFGLTDTQEIVSFLSTAPGTLTSQVAINGLNSGDRLVGIDFRPATSQLFGLGMMNQLYRINPLTGMATAVGTGFTPALNGSFFGFNFNPVPDRIRVVSDRDQNLRLNPNTGAGVNMTGDPNLTFADGIGSPTIFGTSYTNSRPGVQTTTTQYFIDPVLDILGRIDFNNFNAGQIIKVGTLNINVPSNAALGFDISGATNLAYLASGNTLWTVNQMTGAASLVGSIAPTSGFNITALTAAPVPEPGTWAMLGAGLVAVAVRLRRR